MTTQMQNQRRSDGDDNQVRDTFPETRAASAALHQLLPAFQKVARSYCDGMRRNYNLTMPHLVHIPYRFGTQLYGAVQQESTGVGWNN